MTTPRQEDFSTVLGRMTDFCLAHYRYFGSDRNVGLGALVQSGFFTDAEVEAHAEKAMEQAREIYEGEQRESGND